MARYECRGAGSDHCRTTKVGSSGKLCESTIALAHRHVTRWIWNVVDSLEGEKGKKILNKAKVGPKIEVNGLKRGTKVRRGVVDVWRNACAVQLGLVSRLRWCGS